jgi:hypothetical protein
VAQSWLRRALLAFYAAVDGGMHYYIHAELEGCLRKLGLRVELAGKHIPIRHMLVAVLEIT